MMLFKVCVNSALYLYLQVPEVRKGDDYFTFIKGGVPTSGTYKHRICCVVFKGL